jgi:hypothetical protein
LAHTSCLGIGIVVMIVSVCIVASMTLHLSGVVYGRATIMILAMLVALGPTSITLIHWVRNLNIDLRAAGGGVSHGLSVQVDCGCSD